MSTSCCGLSREVQYQPLGRRRRILSATSVSSTSRAASPPKIGSSSLRSGSSAAAQASCGAST
jgi:hypothetical protein